MENKLLVVVIALSLAGLLLAQASDGQIDLPNPFDNSSNTTPVQNATSIPAVVPTTSSPSGGSFGVEILHPVNSSPALNGTADLNASTNSSISNPIPNGSVANGTIQNNKTIQNASASPIPSASAPDQTHPAALTPSASNETPLISQPDASTSSDNSISPIMIIVLLAAVAILLVMAGAVWYFLHLKKKDKKE